MVGFFVVREVPVGLSMVNLKILCDSAILATVAIPSECLLALLIPVWATIIAMSPEPIGVVWAAAVSRFALPSVKAWRTTEDLAADLAGQTFDCLAALLAGCGGSWLVLDMIRAGRRVGFPPFAIAFEAAKRFTETIHAAFFLGSWLRALATFGCNEGCLCLVSTSHATEFLRSMVLRWHERLAAMSARLLYSFGSRLVRASN